MSEEPGLAEELDLTNQSLLQNVEVRETEATNLDHRFVVELSGEAMVDQGDKDWIPIDSHLDPMDAVRACSDFVNSLKSILGVTILDDLPVFTRVLRVIDSKTGSRVLWEENGALKFSDETFVEGASAVETS